MEEDIVFQVRNLNNTDFQLSDQGITFAINTKIKNNISRKNGGIKIKLLCVLRPRGVRKPEVEQVEAER